MSMEVRRNRACISEIACQANDLMALFKQTMADRIANTFTRPCNQKWCAAYSF